MLIITDKGFRVKREMTRPYLLGKKPKTNYWIKEKRLPHNSLSILNSPFSIHHRSIITCRISGLSLSPS